VRAKYLAEKAIQTLDLLCREIPSRRVGSAGNQAASRYFADAVASWGFETESPAFECIDWSSEGAQLSVGDARFEVAANPYSLGCDISGPLCLASNVSELEEAQARGAVVLLQGEIAKEQLMPKSFPFYNPEEHRRIISLLETKLPAAIVAATTQDPGLAGAVSPFPLIEDGDVDIPSVHMTAEEGQRLARHVGETVQLAVVAERIPSWGCNVVARKGDSKGGRIVLFAHIDAKAGTPGAIDNATGVTVLLLLAELLEDYAEGLGIELVALNGEDYYSAPGEQLYVASNAGRFDEIVLGINVDGVGYHAGNTAYSLYGCPPDIASLVRRTLSGRNRLVEGEPWYQSDHGLFLMHDRPAVALTSDRFAELWTRVAHTPGDSPDIVDISKLIDVAFCLAELLLGLNSYLEGQGGDA
jgi:aminopeptidase YwaD